MPTDGKTVQLLSGTKLGVVGSILTLSSSVADSEINAGRAVLHSAVELVSNKGTVNGYASLDSTGHVPSAQISGGGDIFAAVAGAQVSRGNPVTLNPSGDGTIVHADNTVVAPSCCGVAITSALAGGPILVQHRGVAKGLPIQAGNALVAGNFMGDQDGSGNAANLGSGYTPETGFVKARAGIVLAPDSANAFPATNTFDLLVLPGIGTV